jgi:hypothetical protein
MRYLLLTILLLTATTQLLACSCGRGPGRNFLSNVGRFDIVALGRIMKSSNDFTRDLVIEKVYKGSEDFDTLKISNGSMCDNYLNYEEGALIIVGLSRDSKNPNILDTHGCITSSILVENKFASTLQNQLPLSGKPRIGIIKRKIKLKNLERRINMRLWWYELFN